MTILIFLLILTILVLVHELGHFIIAKKMGVRVEEFGIGLPPRLFGVKKGETLYSVNLLPLGGFVKLYGEEYDELDRSDKSRPVHTNKIDKNRTFINKTPWQKTLIILGGVIGNFLLGWFIFSYLVTQGIAVPTNKVIIEKVTKNSPADISGLKERDTILRLIPKNSKIPSISLTSSNSLITLTQKYAGQKISLLVQRNNQQLTINLIPRKNPPKGEGPLGIAITSSIEKKYPWYTAPYYGLIEASNITYKIATELGKLILGLITFQKPHVDVAGPVGIANLAGQAVRFGGNAFLQFIALLSLNLAIINVLPFPALDGGRLVFVFYEGIFKKKPNKDIEKYTNLIGFIMLLSLAALITVNDIIKLIKK
ncbi:MAG: Membrane-associated zinc metalloprotease [Candidatus Roizmanbacteria bacterium GW2011_GWA2_34_18]|uniref:Zinc metalloprotease n=1 Tax=Candidatus Roizmanbacteria bacterium GW2011_GWA2_34_18 TaxID=1618477 RepID=A0A0G0E267_9BACT|nr:MAG: Membrane-associated zinc metalloprotease [Candidatus Roizmanbacteria bacterium GW2011_GWA2_34_18]